MVLAAALPLAHEARARPSVANIGFGSGLTTHALLGSPRVAGRRLDRDRAHDDRGRAALRAAQRRAPTRTRAASIHIEDAKTFFAARGQRYDLIVSEPSNPWVSGVSTLFSEEFYAQVRRYLDGRRPAGAVGAGLRDRRAAALDGLQGARQALRRLRGLHRDGGRPARDRVAAAEGADAHRRASSRFPALADGPRPPRLSRRCSDLEALRVGGRAALEPLFTRSRLSRPTRTTSRSSTSARPGRASSGASADEIRTLRENEVPLVAMLDERGAHAARAPARASTATGPLRLERALCRGGGRGRRS